MAQNLNFNLAVDTNTAVSSINQFFSAFDQGAAKAKNQLNQAFGQTLQTNVQINLKDGELVAKKVQNINQESKRLETAVKAINGQWGKTPNELKRQLTTLKQLQGDTVKYQSGTNKLTADWKRVTQRIKEASSELKRMTQGGPLQQMKASLTGIIGKFAVVQTVANLATSAIMGIARGVGEFAATAQRMEVLQLQLEAFADGADGAAAAFDEFVRIAANSPFNLEQVAQAGKIMMAFGVETETAIDATERLAIVAAATGGDINLLARNLGQIAAQGQAYTRDLTQFAIQGIPIWEEMSKVTGYTTTELKEMASEGKIGFDTVSEALKNLTSETSAYSKVARRMQETFAGRLQRIEAAMQKLALEFINGFNNMDRALGGLVSGSMKLFADTLFAIANNLNTIIASMVALTAATAAFFIVSKWGVIANAIQGAIWTLKLFAATQNIVNTATVFFHALTGNWAAIAVAAGVAGVAYVGMKGAIDSAAQSTRDLQGEAITSAEATGALSEEQEKYFEEMRGGFTDMMEKYKEAKEHMEERKTALNNEVQVLEALKESVKEKYDKEIQGIKDTIAEDRIKQQEMKDNHRERLDEINTRYDAELDLIDLAIGRLRERTSAEESLYQFEKQQLQSKIASGALDKEALLRAKARLSRMERQEQIQELLTKKAATQAKKDKEIATEKGKQEKAEKNMANTIKENEEKVRNLTKERREQVEIMDAALKNAENTTKQIDLSNTSVDKQVGLVNDLAGQYALAKQQVDNLGTSLRQAAAAQRELNAAQAKKSSGSAEGSGTLSARASGGPVTGGSAYQVNELGREAFLSASGKLSMINAPAFGKWRAPGSGTVIPAHLTSQLNIPTGGVNLNSAAASNASRASSGGMGSMVKAIQGAMGGDTFNQSVTVQAANPTQAANNLMVEMTRLRRRRFR